jgi:hypothetical protein
VDEAKNANTPHDAFSLFISDDILNIILTPIKKFHDYLFIFTGKVQKWMRRTSLDELRIVIGLLIYGGVFESLHEHKKSLYKMDGTGRLVFPAVDMLDQMCAGYTVQRTTRNAHMDNGNVLWHDQHCCSKCIGHICKQHAQRSA